MIKNILLLVICFVGISMNAHAQTSEKDSLSDAIKLIDKWLDVQVEFDQIPGLSAGIVKDQELIWSKGYGYANPDEQVQATPQTIYSICSISKLFTSIAIMNLYEEGKLRLDDPVKSILPNFNIEQQFEESGPITIRGLLTHSSGLPRESDYPYWTGPEFKFPSKEEVTTKLGKQETLYNASTYFQYSNLGMTILGEVIEKVSGMPYDQYIEQTILKPLNLNNTKTVLPAGEWGKQMAKGYSAEKRDGTRDPIKLFDARGIKAAAGFSSTVEDLAKFASWQFRLLDSGKEEILKPSTLKEMQRVHWVDPDFNTFWGLGFSVRQQNGDKIVGHGGSCPGYKTTITIDPEDKLSFIVMMNAMDDPGAYANAMRNILQKGKNKKNENSNGPDLSQYAGVYNYQPWSAEILVSEWYGQLAVVGMPSQNPAGSMWLLKHKEGDIFNRVRDDGSLGEQVRFEKDASGKVIRMWQHSNYSEKLQ